GGLPLSSEVQDRRSPWREFAFMFHLVQQTVLPVFSFDNVMKDWSVILTQLAESPRKRKRQMAVSGKTC
ncbi:hypothetical protein, partial [Candidatus Magnetaquicoccus inordinatus]|uniref:hypothetical protein n=1 Tax=Candidatus Magnetaquicoccus inordinatus TaxID=2496818 RepID=UPI001D0E13A6